MRTHRWVATVALMVLPLAAFLSAEDAAPWRDPSPHSVHFVAVEDDVKLEVLDWGGTGRTLVLLAGQGNTAHVFDDFALKLTPDYHVYGITRRGYGDSSAPTSGYTADRLGDDVLAVIDALKLNKPVLVGHSIAGEEMSSVASRHPERVAGLVYLDAGYSYAYYERSIGSYLIDLRELQRNLEKLLPGRSTVDLREQVQLVLQKDLPLFQKDLRELEEELGAPPVTFPPPNAGEARDFAAMRSWAFRVRGLNYPEAELRQTFQTRSDGSIMFNRFRFPPRVTEAILTGEQKYTDIPVPVLSIYAVPHDLGPFSDHNPTARAAYEARDMASTEAQAKAFEKGVPTARVVRLPHANHLIFLSNEGDVLREMRAFMSGLH